MLSDRHVVLMSRVLQAEGGTSAHDHPLASICSVFVSLRPQGSNALWSNAQGFNLLYDFEASRWCHLKRRFSGKRGESTRAAGEHNT